MEDNVNSIEIEKEENSLLKEILNKEKKQLFFTRIAGISVLAIAVMILITLMILVPKAVYTLNNINDCVTTATATLDTAEETMKALEQVSADISVAANGVNTLLVTNSEALSDSMKKISEVDYEGLNLAIQDLQAIVEPLAKMMGVFK